MGQSGPQRRNAEPEELYKDINILPFLNFQRLRLMRRLQWVDKQETPQKYQANLH